MKVWRFAVVRQGGVRWLFIAAMTEEGARSVAEAHMGWPGGPVEVPSPAIECHNLSTNVTEAGVLVSSAE